MAPFERWRTWAQRVGLHLKPAERSLSSISRSGYQVVE
jgi:hypothetical protein